MNVSTLPLQTELHPHTRALPYHCESSVVVSASPDAVFQYADDHEHLSMHMGESSWMMCMGRMSTELDAARGQAVGSEIRLSGKVLGMRLHVVEKVTQRLPPLSKVWEATESPRLLVVGHYRMGFEVAPRDNASLLRVFIDFALPDLLPSRWLGYVFGRTYARWCTRQMVDGVSRHFQANGYQTN